MLNKTIRATARNRVIIYLIILLAITGILLGFQHQIRGAFQGPKVVSLDDYSANSAKYNDMYISVEVGKSFDTGISLRKDGSDEDLGFYQGMLSNGKALLAKTATTRPFAKAVGIVKLDSSENEFMANSEFKRHAQELNLTVDPYIIDTTAFSRNGVFGWAGFGALVALFVLALFLVSLRIFLNPQHHAIHAKLIAAGARPEDLIELETDATEFTEKSGSLTLLTHSAINKTAFAVNVILYRDVVWIYPLVTQKRVNFIPAGKTYTTVISAASGVQIKCIGSSKAKAEAQYTAITQRCPHAIKGFSAELASRWKTNRASLIAYVSEEQAKAPRF